MEICVITAGRSSPQPCSSFGKGMLWGIAVGAECVGTGEHISLSTRIFWKSPSRHSLGCGAGAAPVWAGGGDWGIGFPLKAARISLSGVVDTEKMRDSFFLHFVAFPTGVFFWATSPMTISVNKVALAFCPSLENFTFLLLMFWKRNSLAVLSQGLHVTTFPACYYEIIKCSYFIGNWPKRNPRILHAWQLEQYGIISA